MNDRTRNAISAQELESRFVASGVSLRHLYPWWYRTYRVIGIRTRPPVLYRWSEHLLYVGSGVAVVLATGAAALWWYDGAPPWRVLPLVLLVVITPGWHWLRYRRIRRRLDLDDGSDSSVV